MPDLWLDVDTEIQECPVNILPLTDDTDFKSRETAVAYNATGMDLVWNFITCAGAFTQTAVTPATGSPPTDYAWVNQGDGMYTIDIPASGGATINNDTEGFGWFSGVATGVLPWRGPTIGFRAAGLNDKIVESAYSTTRGLAGTALPDAAAEASGGLFTRGTGAGQINQDSNGRIDTNVAAISADSTAADNCELMFDGTGYAGGTTKLKVDLETIKTQAVTCAGGVTVPAATLASTTNITAASGVTLTATTGLGNQTANITGTITTATNLTNAPPDSSGVTTLLSRIVGTLAAGTHNAQTGDSYAIVNSGTYGNSALKTLIDTIDDFLDTEIAALLADTNELQTDWVNGGRLDLLIDAIKAKTDNLPASPAAVGSAMALAANAVDASALAADAVDEILDEVVEGTTTLRQAIRLFLSALTGKCSGGGTTTITFRDIGDTKDRLVLTVDSSGNRTAVGTRDGS